MRTRKACVSNAVLLTGLLWASQTTVFADKDKSVPAVPALFHGHSGLLSPRSTKIGLPDPAAAARVTSPKNMPAAAASGLDKSKSQSPDHGGSKTSDRGTSKSSDQGGSKRSDHGKSKSSDEESSKSDQASSKSSKDTDEASQPVTVETTASKSKSIDRLPTCL